MKNTKGTSLLLLLCAAFICNPLFDFISITLNSGGTESSRVSLISRGILSTAILISAIALNIRNKNKIITLSALILPIASCTIWLLLGFYDEKTFLENLVYITKLASFFSFLYTIKTLKPAQFSKLESIVKSSLFIYLACILAGAIFDINSFRSYALADRSGYKGIIIAQNEAAGLILVATLISAANITQRIAIKSDIIIFSLAITASLLLGAKASLIGALLSIISVCVARYGFARATPIIIISLITISSVALLAYNLNTEINIAVQSSLSYFEYQYDNYAQGNIFTLLLSGRDNKLDYVLNNILSKNYLYLITGGYPMGNYSIEIDFPDLILLMGAPTASLYILQFISSFKTRNKSMKLFAMLSLGSILIISNTAGHIFVSALVLPYISFLCEKINRPNV